MRALNRKLLRDLRRFWGQVLSIALVVASGVSVFLACLSTDRSLREERRVYYDSTRFAEVFAPLKRAPASLAARLSALPGIASVECRIIQDAPVAMDDPGGPVSCRILSLPPAGVPGMNRLTLRQGWWPERGSSKDVLVSETFARTHGLFPGSSLSVVLQGKQLNLKVAGWVLSPEFIYPIRPGEFLPDDRRFGLVWMGEEGLASASGFSGAFNDVLFSLTPGASEPDALAAIDRVLDPYGGLGAYGRADQLSNRYLDDELKELRTFSVTVPAIFLSVAAFLITVVMARLVSTERTQIATLKALGYGNARIGLHYLSFALVIVLIGAVLGIASGAWIGWILTRMYTWFFHFPSLYFRAEPWVAFVGVALSAAAAMAGALGAVLRVVRLAPAEAMQPPSPPSYRRGALDRIPFFNHASQQARMVARHVSRRPLRTILGAVGVASAVAILVMGSFALDSFRYLMHVQYTWIQREDVAVGFSRALSAQDVRALSALPGVLRAEGVRAVPVVLRAGHLSRKTALIGIDPRHRLQGLVDEKLHPIVVPPEALLLSQRLGERLGVAAGDFLWVEVREGLRRTRRVPVAGLAEEMLGFSAYMDDQALQRLLGEGHVASGARLAVDRAQEAALFRHLGRLPVVGTVSPKRAALENFRRTTAEYISTFTAVLIGFALVIVVGVVYNSARIIVAERMRDLATLRVLGFTTAEIFRIFEAELAVQVVTGVPLGLWVGERLSALMITTAVPEAFKLPLVIESGTYVRSAGAVLIAAAVTTFFIRRSLAALDLVAVLKTRE